MPFNSSERVREEYGIESGRKKRKLLIKKENTMRHGVWENCGGGSLCLKRQRALKKGKRYKQKRAEHAG